MEVIVRGRHITVPARFRQHAAAKLAKLEKLDPKAVRIDVEVSEERNPRQSDRRERVELTIRSRGPAIRAEAAADDRYAALDLAFAKLESRLRRVADRRKVKDTVSVRSPGMLAGAVPDAQKFATTKDTLARNIRQYKQANAAMQWLSAGRDAANLRLRQGVREHFGAFEQGIASGLAIRHDHGSAYMSDDFQRELTFLGMASSPSFVREPEGNGVAERFIRTLKENLLWIRHFATVAELAEALREFKRTYNEQWLIERHGFRTPSQARHALPPRTLSVA